jgi:general secretion pathway protein G
MEVNPGHRSPGMTLLEMMLVLAIIAVLLGLGAFKMKNVLSDADLTKAAADIKNIETNLVRFKAKAMFFPTEEQGLSALVKPPTSGPRPKQWSQCLDDAALVDPWGNPYQYRNPGSRNPNGQDVYTMGPDGKDGTDDDIGNW